MVDKACLPDGLDNVAQGVVHHPVTKGRGADETPFGFEDIKAVVATWPIGLLA